MKNNSYKYSGAGSLIQLHAKYLTEYLSVWKKAKKLNINLPETKDVDYESLDTLLRHVLRAARGYMTWMCEKLNIADPEIKPTPEAKVIEKESDEYLIHLLEKWHLPLVEIPEEKFHSPVYKSRWGVEYCIDAMLEHAVMHPIRHSYQLERLIDEQS
jgi:uncharacterized damage-inducible protein DinB